MVLIHQAFVCKADWRIGQTEVAEVWSSMNTMNWRYWAQPFHFFGDVVTPKLKSVRWARRLPFGYRSAWVLGHVGTADLVFEVCFKWCRRRPLNACKCLQHYVKSRQGCTTWLLQFLPWNMTYCNKFRYLNTSCANGSKFHFSICHGGLCKRMHKQTALFNWCICSNMENQKSLL